MTFTILEAKVEPRTENIDPLEEFYKNKIAYLIAFASRHVYNRDYAIDVVHDGLAMVLQWSRKNPGKRVDMNVVKFLILRACKKANKYANEVQLPNE